jgi:hypothetical protein
VLYVLSVLPSMIHEPDRQNSRLPSALGVLAAWAAAALLVGGSLLRLRNA